MNIVIPMAGEGRRFADAGYTDPKPLIDIAGRRMIDLVIGCLDVQPLDDVTLISRIPVPGYNVVLLAEPTQGAADTLLYAPLDGRATLVANCDQYVTCAARYHLPALELDANVMTFNSTNPHHSYVRRTNGWVTEIAEKRVISDEAVLGIYWFRSGTMLRDYAEKTVATAERMNGEYYISAILDLMVRDGLHIGTFEVDVHHKHMLGTPEELRIFLDKVADGRVVL